MAVSKCASQYPYIEEDYIELEVNGEPVEQVSNFVYLDVTINGDGRIDRDLNIRIQQAYGAFHQLWNSRTIKNQLRSIYIYRAAVISIPAIWC